MRKPALIVVVLGIVCVASGEAVPPKGAWLEIRQLRPCTCSEIQAEAGSPAACGGAGYDIRGTSLVVGGRRIDQVELRDHGLDDNPLAWVKGKQPFDRGATRADGSVDWHTVLRFRYTDGSILDVSDPIQATPGAWRVWVYNDRRSRSFLVYVGDTADFVRLACVLDGDRIMCDQYVEV